jgi:aspartyl-tRNA(Asn)/glutamyl-tRNA(Gln) amidotransferase subunit A
MTGIADLTSGDLVRLYRRRLLSPVDVAADVLSRIEANRAINAFMPIEPERVLAQARGAEQRWQHDAPQGQIDGVPVTIKDNISVAGMATLRGSRTCDGAPAREDAPAVARLREAGAVIIGKTCMPEYGWIGACHSPLTGITRNPWNLERTTGGSTGGGAAAALLNLGVLHLGTDGAGSLRIPASFTGVFGLKPTYGQVPAYPPSPFNVLAHQGPITRSVGEAAVMLSIISAPDARDMTAWNTPAVDFTAGLEDGVRGLRIAWSPRLGQEIALDPEVEAATKRTMALLADGGAVIEAADPDLADAGGIIRTLWFAGARSIVDSVRENRRAEMDPGLLQVAEWGQSVTTSEYIAAYSARSALDRTMLDFHRRYDLVVTPTMPITAFEVGHASPPNSPFGKDWLDWSPYTYPFNLTQQPAASVPCGLSSQGLPIGLQIVGARGADRLVLRAARAIELMLPFPKPAPILE